MSYKRLTKEERAAIPDRIDEWIRELRFGGHEQTTNNLHSTYKHGREQFCCLGVAVSKVLHRPRTSPVGYVDVAYDGNDSRLVSHRLIGLRTDSGDPARSHANSLTELNDYGHRLKIGEEVSVDFAYIADLLEIDLRINCWGYFTPEARAAWCQKHGFLP